MTTFEIKYADGSSKVYEVEFKPWPTWDMCSSLAVGMLLSKGGKMVSFSSADGLSGSVSGDMIVKRYRLDQMFDAFERYMTSEKWDSLGTDGIYEDDGLEAVSSFLEFVKYGYGTDHEGGTL